MSQTVEEVLKQREDQEDVNTNSPSAVVKGQLYETDWDIYFAVEDKCFQLSVNDGKVICKEITS